MPQVLLDAAGRPPPPAPVPGYHAGRSPRNKGQRYPARPAHGRRDRRRDPTRRHRRVRSTTARPHRRAVARGLAHPRGSRASAKRTLTREADLDPRRGALLVRRGKGGRRREVGMDDWAWEHLQPWLTARVDLPVGPPLCNRCTKLYMRNAD
jgi:hypothetical protein